MGPISPMRDGAQDRERRKKKKEKNKVHSKGSTK